MSKPAWTAVVGAGVALLGGLGCGTGSLSGGAGPCRREVGVAGDCAATFGSLAAGPTSTMWVSPDGTVRAWGSLVITNGLDILHGHLVPTEIPELTGVARIAIGAMHACAVLADGNVSCWGDNAYGQLGDDTPTGRVTPSPPFAVGDATRIAGGDTFTCALLSSGTGKCWGSWLDGQLGAQVSNLELTTTGGSLPVAVDGLAGAIGLGTNGEHTCALLSDGTVRCWGGADPAFPDAWTRETPVPLPGLAGVVHLAVGAVHGCAVLSDGSARCWGNQSNGALGNGVTEGLHPEPVPVAGLTDAVEIAVGPGRCCALHADGTVSCWGWGDHGALGNGTLDDRSVPTPVPGLTDVVQLAMGRGHTCALRSDQTVRCWGANESGQLGDGTTTDRALPAP